MKGEILYYSDPYYFRVESLDQNFYPGYEEDEQITTFYEVWESYGKLHKPGDFTMQRVVIPMEFLA